MNNALLVILFSVTSITSFGQKLPDLDLAPIFSQSDRIVSSNDINERYGINSITKTLNYVGDLVKYENVDYTAGNKITINRMTGGCVVKATIKEMPNDYKSKFTVADIQLIIKDKRVREHSSAISLLVDGGRCDKFDMGMGFSKFSCESEIKSSNSLVTLNLKSKETGYDSPGLTGIIVDTEIKDLTANGINEIVFASKSFKVGPFFYPGRRLEAIEIHCENFAAVSAKND